VMASTTIGAKLKTKIEGSGALHVAISVGSYEVHRTFADQAVELLLAVCTFRH
jgi:hypothetical protein